MESHSEHRMNFQPNLRAKTLVIDDDTTSPVNLGPTQTRVLIDTTSTVTINLPSVAEASGRVYTFEPIGSTVPDISIADEDGSMDWSGPYALDAATERIALYSNGISWWEWGATYYS